MASSQQPEPITLTYKSEKGNQGEQVDIPLDVYAPSRPKEPVTPVIWLHTGGLLQGTRKFIPPHLVRAVESHNLVIVAPDFRLCPQVPLVSVLADVRDCVDFLFHADRLSTTISAKVKRDYVLAGSSAGGWLSLLLGLDLVSSNSSDSSLTSLRLEPAPAAVVAIYPITTVEKGLAPYFHKALSPLPWAYSANNKPGDVCPGEPLKEHLDKRAKVLSESPPAKNPVRATLYNYARQEGIYPSLVLRDGKETGEEVAFSVPTQIRQSNNPFNKPVFIAYGDADIMVETEQSKLVIEALKAKKFDVQVHVEPGKSHLYDMQPEVEIPGFCDWIVKSTRGNAA